MDFAEIRERAQYEIKNFLEDKNNKFLAIGFAVILLLCSIYAGYKHYYNNVQRNAQRDFSQAMQTYNEALSGKAKKENIWNEVEFAFKTGYEQNQSSSLAPFFLIYESEALLKLNNKEDAYKILSQAVNSMQSKSLFSYFYQIKQALMEIDLNQLDLGLKHLQALANDTNNQFSNLANFYLGQYYWSQNDINKAQQYFSLVSKDSTKIKDGPMQSPWVKEAQEKLDQLN